MVDGEYYMSTSLRYSCRVDLITSHQLDQRIQVRPIKAQGPRQAEV